MSSTVSSFLSQLNGICASSTFKQEWNFVTPMQRLDLSLLFIRQYEILSSFATGTKANDLLLSPLSDSSADWWQESSAYKQNQKEENNYKNHKQES